jgi:hypothetical protein
MKMMLLSKIKVVTAMLLVVSALAVGGTGLAFRAQADGPTGQEDDLQGRIYQKREELQRLIEEQKRRGHGEGQEHGTRNAPGPIKAELSPYKQRRQEVAPAPAPSPAPDPRPAADVGVAGPGLDALADNGGPPQTIAFLPGSPAIDVGSNSLAVDPSTGPPLTTDQRDAGFPPIVNAMVNVGAFEVQTTDHLAVTSQPPGSVAPGSRFGLTVTAEDKSGHVIGSFDGTVTAALAADPGGATLGGTLSVKARAGVATFSGLMLDKAGIGYTLQVTSNGLTAATSNPFNVQANTFINFDNLTATSGFFEGTAIAAQARLSDQLANRGVIFSTGKGTDYVAVVPLGEGHATSGTNGISMASTDEEVTYSVPCYTVIKFVDPANPSVGAVTNFVSIRGDFGGSTNTLTMQAFDINGILLGTDSQPDVGGETVSLSLPGIHSVHIVTTAEGDVGGIALDDLAFNTPVSAANHLVVTSQPPGSVAPGSRFSLTVTAEDKSGHVIGSFDGTVTAALAADPGGATLGGTLSVKARAGVATFSGLTVDKPGIGYRLKVSSSGLTTATTSAFNVGRE